ncbi:MAG TPA: hypothetical protein ENG13_01945 [bacterium]|nr:hypothetical protein [bacterium]HEX67811.1 hypothetical protein [bacterium]
MRNFPKHILWLFLSFLLLCGFRWKWGKTKITCITQNEKWIRCSIVALSKDYILYRASHEHLGDEYLYLYDLKTRRTKRVLPQPVTHAGIRADGDLAVIGKKENIYLCNLKTGKTQLLYSGGYAPDISGNKVIWRDKKTLKLCVYDLESRKMETLKNVGRMFRISGNWLVWRVITGDLCVLNLSTKETEILDLGPVHEIDIAGDILVVSSGPERHQDIWMYDLKKGKEVVVANTPKNEYLPATDGKKIVWVTPIDESEFEPLPWSKLATYRLWQNIFLYDIKTKRTKRIVHNDFMITRVLVKGKRVVWTSGRIKRPQCAKEYNENPRDIYIYER